MRMSAKLLLLILLVLGGLLPITATMAQVKRLEAVKTQQSIKIDGNISEAAWQEAPIASDFVKAFPDFGKKSSKRTEVKVLYDDVAVYVAAYMYDDKINIRKQLTQRDVLERQDVDVFSIGFDTYHDRQNAFIFQVSSAGVQGDARQSQTGTSQDNGGFDRSWDAVWISSTRINADGWVAELKIPYSAIRFSKKKVQDWGIQFTRFSRTLNEESTWSPQDPNISGNINQWGDWAGINNIVPPLRLSLLPYLSSGVRVSPTNSGNITEFLKSGGMDVKYGINESFTLDMTLIPDFAQVRSDNIFLNLSPFQVRFDDFRPFFTEGTELFNKAGLFYSRRIGAAPGGTQDVLNFADGNPQYSIVKNPGITRLYNATKFSGRTKNNLGIGVLNSVSAPMYAKLRNNVTGEDSSILTEPLTNYNIIVFDQALKNRSSISFTNTNVMRKGNSRNANVSSVDLSFFDKKNNYNLRWMGRYSSIWGNQGNYNGFTSRASYGKVSGKLQYEVSTGVESDQYDPNDLGFLQNNNSFNYSGSISYIINQPTKTFLRKSINFNFFNNYLYKPFVWTELEANMNASVVFKNFWDLSLVINTKPFWFNDYFEARTPGVLMKRIPYYFIGTGGSSDSRKKLFVNWFMGFAESQWPNDRYTTFEGGLRYRFNDRLQLSTNWEAQNDRGAWGYSHRDNVSTMVPGYYDPIVSFRKVRTSNLIFSGQYSFTPRMNWTVRLRHNWAHVDHVNFYKLKTDGYWNEIAFQPGLNRNFNAFNIDMFYTWDFKWGSRLTLAWKNALSGNVSINPYDNTSLLKNFRSSLNSPHSNELSLKVVYFIDYLDLKKKKRG
jgi:Domain of unknown function (DUF5916)/Carbohydrate family 9 binding domain-like